LIAVVGSVNRDLVVRAHRLPSPGETVAGIEHHETAGGKGANQAVAAARLGSRVSILGRIGDDGAGHDLRSGLAADGVDVSGVVVDREASTGLALITVDDAGENSIVVVPGANGRVTPRDVGRWRPIIATAAVVLLQFEIPLDAVEAAAVAATGTVIVNPAPIAEVPAELLSRTDMLIANRSEAAAIGDPATIGVRTVIVTLGGDGAMVYHEGEQRRVLAPAVGVVDTTGAGDAFCGALAAAIDAGLSLDEGVTRAVAAGALATTAVGARGGMPHAAVLDAFVNV